MDARIRKLHNAWYGNVVLDRAYCTDCEGFALIIEGKIQCCDKQVAETPIKHKRISDVATGRHRPSRINQLRILREQDNRCLYCLRGFASYLWLGQRRLKLRVEWDHLIPYTYSMNNHIENFVASCQICNRLKGALIFQTLEEARVHVYNKAIEKGYTEMRPVLGEFHPEKTLAKVL